MNNAANKILLKLRESGYCDPEFQPFRNRYYWNPDMELSACGQDDLELYNESILVLDEKGPYSDDAYIMQIEKSRLNILMRYFGICPIHQTNRIGIETESFVQVNNDYISTLTRLISKHIRPRVIITFSGSVGMFFKNNYTVFLEDHKECTGFWKGIILIGKRYFYLYCLPVIELYSIDSEKNDPFFMSSIVYDKQTCHLLNSVAAAIPGFQFPSGPLNNSAVRAALRNLAGVNDAQVPRFLYARGEISELCGDISGFNEFDLVVAQRIIYAYPGQKTVLSKDEYLEVRKTESPEVICRRHLDASNLSYSHYLLRLSLVQLYLFIVYPREALAASCEKARLLSELFSTIYHDTLYDIKKFK